jgi:hypothetical protein
MTNRQNTGSAVEAAIGYAADTRGVGLAYARLSGAVSRLARFRFEVPKHGPLTDRAIAYAAVATIAKALCARGIRHVRFLLGDAQLAREIASQPEIPEALVLPYVHLRCILNSLESFSVQPAATDDLTQRARAEVALNVAA